MYKARPISNQFYGEGISKHLDAGYLVIYDHAETKIWKNEWVEAYGERVFMVWV